MTLTLDKTHVRVGEETPGRVLMENASTGPVTVLGFGLGYPSDNRGVIMEIRAPDGSLYEGYRSHLYDFPHRVLDPRKRLRLEVGWSQFFDFDLQKFYRLNAPGTYTVRAIYTPAFLDATVDLTGRFESLPVSITVLPD